MGEPGEAHRLLAELQGRLSRIDSPWGEASAGRCEGLILAANGDLEGASSALERALAVHEGSHNLSTWPAPCSPSARSSGGRKSAARRARALERSLAIFDELGATLWAEKARSELLRISGRTLRRRLTPTERRIADLVAKGKTNKEVAAQLFVTPRTVEGHLTRIYAKLGVRSRAGLAHRMSVPAG